MVTPVLPRFKMTVAQESAMQTLCIPILSRIVALEMIGLLPALAGLSNAGSGIFTETVILLDRDPLAKQLSEYMLEMNFVVKTREDYDHHVTLTPFGKRFLYLFTRPMSLHEEEKMLAELKRSEGRG